MAEEEELDWRRQDCTDSYYCAINALRLIGICNGIYEPLSESEADEAADFRKKHAAHWEALGSMERDGKDV